MNSQLNRISWTLLSLMPILALSNAWEFIVISGISIRFLDILFVTLWISATILVLRAEQIRVDTLIFIILLAVLFIMSLAGSVLNQKYQVNWPKLIRFFQTILWGALPLAYSTKKRHLQRVVYCVIIAGSLISISSIILYFTDPSLHRIAGFFNAAGGEGYDGVPNFNSIGAFHSLAILLSLSTLNFNIKFKNNRAIKFLLVGALVVNILGLLFTNSRSALLSLLVSMAVFGYLLFYASPEDIRKNKPYITVTSIIGIGLLSVLFSFLFLSVNRLGNTFIKGTNAYDSLVTRFGLWQAGFTTWFSEPIYFIFGYGFGSSTRFIGAESAHNFFLNIGMWFGLIGLVIILLILFWPLTRLVRRTDNHHATQIGAVTISNAFVVSIFGNVLVNPVFGGVTFLVLFAAYAAKDY